MLVDILQIIILFILPVILVYFHIIPFKHRIHTLYVVTILVVAIILFEGWSLTNLGIRLDNIKESFTPYAIFTVIGILIILAVSRILKRKPQPDFFKKKHFIYGFILVSIAQEFLFRGFLMPRLQNVLGSYKMAFGYEITLILINAILFMLIHLVYSNNVVSLSMILIGGICYAGIYLIYPNLILIIISHAILNFLAVLYNFYHEEKTTIKIVNHWVRIRAYMDRIKDKAKRRKSNP